MSIYRTRNCGSLNKSHTGEVVILSGWLHRRRDHGSLIFLDMRDHYGLVQLVVGPEAGATFETVGQLTPESVFRIRGTVVVRSQDTINLSLPTGEIEVHVETCEILSLAQLLPFPVFGESQYPEDVRLRYRFLDLRRKVLHDNIVTRSRFIASLRQRMIQAGFLELQTPILTASSPEGARDFLVPSRLHKGKFYALPQAPQQFKQLAMVAGFDKYFQVAPCFRDEDSRADRSPGEFYQLDIEMSFVEQEDIFQMIEPVLHDVFEEFGNGKKVNYPFPRITFDESMLRYGTDKPDLRNPIKISDVTPFFSYKDVTLQVFKDLIDQGAIVCCIPAPGAAQKPHSFFDKIKAWAQEKGAQGLAYIILKKDGENFVGEGPLAKFVGEQTLQGMARHTDAREGDVLFFVCDQQDEARGLAGQVRMEIGRRLDLIQEDMFAFCWVVDFPFYEWDSATQKIIFSHNPFSMPQGGLHALETRDPLTIKAFQYDVVCNGVELSSGAIRNHDPAVMYKAFSIVGYDQERVEREFSGMLHAFQYGAPPHGGLAPGIDRMVMLICGEQNLREVTMFPLTQKGEDLMMGAPCRASSEQLKELGMRVVSED